MLPTALGAGLEAETEEEAGAEAEGAGGGADGIEGVRSRKELGL